MSVVEGEIDAVHEGAGVGEAWKARAIVAIVGSAFSVKPGAITGMQRGTETTAFARQVSVYLLHTRLGLNYSRAAVAVRRDRTTAAHACRVVEEARENPRIDAILDCLERAVDSLGRSA